MRIGIANVMIEAIIDGLDGYMCQILSKTYYEGNPVVTMINCCSFA